MGDITFFAKDKQGNYRFLSRDASADLLAEADGTPMKLDNQKNGWKGVCINQEEMGTPSIALSGHWAEDISIFA